MTKKQIEYLKLLGYKNTVEDGAILEHNALCGMAGYIWSGQKFDDVLVNFQANFEYALRLKIANNIRNNK